MKELRLPWLHWNSVAQEIPLGSFPPDHRFRPIRCSPPAKRRHPRTPGGAAGRPALDAGAARPPLAEPGGVAAPRELVQHLLTTTTVNIVSSEERSRGSKPEFGLPPTFFLDVETIVNQLGLEITGLGQAFQVRRPLYEQALAAVGVALKDLDRASARRATPSSPGRFRSGRSRTASSSPSWCAAASSRPVRARASHGRSMESNRLAARARLLAYVPAGRTESRDRPHTTEDIAAAAAGLPPDAPESVAASYLALDEAGVRRAPRARSTPTWRRCGPASAPPRAWSTSCASRTGAAARSAGAGSLNSTLAAVRRGRRRRASTRDDEGRRSDRQGCDDRV